MNASEVLTTQGTPTVLTGRLRAPVLTFGVLGAMTTLVAIRSPHVGGSYGICPVLWLTGMYCAGCGVLRGTYDLAHLDIGAAWAMNPLWVIAVPLIVAGLLWWTTRRWAEHRALASGEQPRARGLLSPAWPAVGAGILIIFSILRNVPALSPWLGPVGG